MQKKFKYIFLAFIIIVILSVDVEAKTCCSTCSIRANPQECLKNCVDCNSNTNNSNTNNPLIDTTLKDIIDDNSNKNTQKNNSNQTSGACIGSNGCINCSGSAEVACKQSAAYKQYQNSQNNNCESRCKGIQSASAKDECLKKCSESTSNSSGGITGGGAPSIGGNNGGVANPNETVIQKTDVGITMKDEGETGELDCGVFDKNTATGKYLHDIYNIIKFAVPIILLALSIVDFAKAIINDNSDELKKATTMFSKRLIVAIVILIVPTILNFVLDLFGLKNCFKF